MTVPAGPRVDRITARSHVRLLAVPLVALACAGGQRRVTGSAPFPAGTYAFAADLPGDVKFTGALIVTIDTMVPRPTDGDCRTPPGPPGRTSIVYECHVPGFDELVLSFDRTSPLRRSEWGVMASVRKRRSVCTQWRTWENGSRSCTRSDPEEYFVRSRVVGKLVITQPAPVAIR